VRKILNLYGGRVFGVVSRDHATFLKLRFRLNFIDHRKDRTYNEPRPNIRSLKSGFKSFSTNIIPVTNQIENQKLISIESNLKFSKYDEHINGAFLRQNLGCLGSLVIESNVGTDVLHELNLLFRTGGADDLEALGFRELDDKSTSSVYFMSFSN
jgi:hypothetical protein